MRWIAILIVTMLLASAAKAQDLAPLVNQETFRVTRYNLAQLEAPGLKQWVSDRLGNAGAPKAATEASWKARREGLETIFSILHAGPSIGHTIVSLTPSPSRTVWLAFPVTPQQKDNVGEAMEMMEFKGFKSGFFVLAPQAGFETDETITTQKTLDAFVPAPRPELLAMLPKEPPLLASVLTLDDVRRKLLDDAQKVAAAAGSNGPDLTDLNFLESARLIMRVEPEVSFTIELTPASGATLENIKSLWPQLASTTFSDLQLDSLGLIVAAIAQVEPVAENGKFTVKLDTAAIDTQIKKLVK